MEGVIFQPHEAGHTAEVRVDAGEPAPDESHFFVAVCAHRPQVGNPTFVYVPRAANVLRERERHIAMLEGELAQKDEWLDKAQQDLAEFDREHQKLLGMFREQTAELEKSNAWAESLNRELEERAARIAELQDEHDARAGRGARPWRRPTKPRSSSWRTMCAPRRSGRSTPRPASRPSSRSSGQELAQCVEVLHRTEEELEERTAWALRLQEEARALDEQAGHVPRLAMGQAGTPDRPGPGSSHQLTWPS